MNGYKANLCSHDVWSLLQRNWIHFWLTGETPQTLSQLVTEIEDKFFPLQSQGRKFLLDMRNKVVPVFRWFKFTLKPPNSITSDNFLSAIWDTSQWNFLIKFGLKTA